ncbi:unnamed protein product [Schistosoma curassoni]|uniref:tRNA-synt_1g domain-containing protein n=1 Tax=Schistosoma curassoni TaxID=6186 RepID=A0A183JMZ3_9TREM|nr:unnamed protein product [Schistosoma curassoni]
MCKKRFTSRFVYVQKIQGIYSISDVYSFLLHKFSFLNRFHAVLWPALLMAVNLPLPRRLICHHHVLVDNVKVIFFFSQSVTCNVRPVTYVHRFKLSHHISTVRCSYQDVGVVEIVT